MSRESDRALLLAYLRWAHDDYDDERGWEGNADAFLAHQAAGSCPACDDGSTPGTVPSEK